MKMEQNVNQEYSSNFSKMSFLSKKIVIIGSGISGLACAFSLKEWGFTNVCILEAQDRIGGRLKTVKLGTHHIEMGAQWIHGQRNNIIYDIAKSNNLIDEISPSYIEKIHSFKYLSEETKSIVLSIVNYLHQKLEQITFDEDENTSVLSYLREEFNKFREDFLSQSFADTWEEVFQWFCKFQCELNGCPNLGLLSKASICAYKECEGHQTVELKHGYQSILDIFLQNVPKDWILKNNVVTKVDWSASSDNSPILESERKYNATIYCENGKEYFADHVIVTVPLGYLKKYYQTFFTPSLSTKKQQAISCLGFGVVNKIFLEFESPFWEEYAVINVLWDNILEEYFFKENSSLKNTAVGVWIKDINRFAYALTHSNMLCAWIVGEGAIAVEYLSDKKVIEDCLCLLEYIFKKKIGKPSKILRSSWSNDPYTHGSYSYVSIQCDKVSNKDLAEPEYSDGAFPKAPILLFAGEATHESYFSTVHGACESGFREANRLFQYYRNLCSNFYFDKVSTISCDLKKLFSPKQSLREEVKIAIIGAGLAGLACASHLVKNNFTNIFVVEAQNRIGGRVCSIKHGDSFLELGAQWIHGTQNELFKFAKENGILSPVLDTFSGEGKGTFCSSSGNVVDASLVESVKNILDGVKSFLEKSDCHSKNTSVLGAYSDAFKSLISTVNDQSNISLLKGMYNWYIRFELIDNACETLETIATQSFADWDDCDPGVYHIMIEGGYSSLIKALAVQMPENRILLNKPVKTLKWLPDFKQSSFSESNKPVLVECEDGETFSVDCAIITSSIGFLQENFYSFFNPPLPVNKYNALKRFGFGTINKFYLVYEKAFWHSDDLGIQLIWEENLNEESQKLLNENPWVRGITGFDINTKLPNILLGWIGGLEAIMIEEISDDDVCFVCTKLLKIFCNSSDLPTPLKVYRSKWYENRYVRGAYSNRSLSYYQFESTLNDLQYPLCSTYATKKGLEFRWPIIMFAGEALDLHAFSSAHGAYQSGFKTAESMIEVFSQIENSEDF